MVFPDGKSVFICVLKLITTLSQMKQLSRSLPATLFLIRNDNMHQIMLLLHNYTRWLVLVGMILATAWAWQGLLRKRIWSVWDQRFGAVFAIAITVQFIWGVVM